MKKHKRSFFQLDCTEIDTLMANNKQLITIWRTNKTGWWNSNKTA